LLLQKNHERLLQRQNCVPFYNLLSFFPSLKDNL